MKNRPRRIVSREEWSVIAGKIKLALANMHDAYDVMLITTTVKEAEVFRRAIKKMQTAWHAAEKECFNQYGETGLWHGEGWVYLA